MNKKTFLIVVFIVWVQSMGAVHPSSYPPIANMEPLHEMRAVWLATIGGIDWPHSYSQSELSAERQKKELCDILDRLVAANINTVLLQTRIRGTTIFPSEMEPWDGCLSGKPSKSPGYDALAFAIEECHKRGIKLHAWIVAIPVGKWNKEGCMALRKTSPEILKRIGDEGFLNPEKSGTADYLANFCRDITRRYDVDGIHLDYIRYPDAWKVIKDRDKGRANITRIVQAVHDAVKAEKPWVIMSCSPIGKYADTKRQSSYGWNSKDIVCQDVALWLKKGLMDVIFPMMYFRGNNFYPFVIDWQERSEDRIITPGLGIYLLDSEQRDWPLTDITQEMQILRRYGMGYCLFRSKFFTDDTKGIYTYNRECFARYPSLQPPMTWYNKKNPAQPIELKVLDNCDGTITLSWKEDSMTMSEITKNDNTLLYNVYGSSMPTVDTKLAENLLLAAYDGNAIVIPSNHYVRYFAVTATDRYGNESAPCQLYNEKNIILNNEASYKLLDCDGKYVYLNGCCISAGQLVYICGIVGNVQNSCLVKIESETPCVDVSNLDIGHYIIYLVNKKGYRHRLGMFSQYVQLPLS